MSFQDVGKKGSQRRPVSGGMNSSGGGFISSGGSNNATPPSSLGGALASLPSATAMSQISDSLTQYQRNVGILEKIASALLTNMNPASRTELETQYKAQCDVLRQLESRLKEQILAQRQRIGTGTQKQALSKLERDFEKVQGSVQVTKSKVAKQQKQYAARGAAAAMEAQSSTQNYLQQQHAQQQLQLQQDRLQEEIMREREDEIRAINKGMHQVNQIYKDLAHIVGEQQTSVDAIETQMEDARSTAQSGLDQVHQANEKYGNSQCAIM